jgi:hypothetical protein
MELKIPNFTLLAMQVISLLSFSSQRLLRGEIYIIFMGSWGEGGEVERQEIERKLFLNGIKTFMHKHTHTQEGE